MPDEVNPLVAKWSDKGHIEDAIHRAESKAFALMRQMPNGVPPRVMFAGNLLAVDLIMQQFVAVMADIAAGVWQWDRTTVLRTRHELMQLFELTKQDAMVTVLENETMRSEARSETKESKAGMVGDAAVEGEAETKAEGDETRDVQPQGVHPVEEGHSRVPPTPTPGQDVAGPPVAGGEDPEGPDGDDDRRVE